MSSGKVPRPSVFVPRKWGSSQHFPPRASGWVRSGVCAEFGAPRAVWEELTNQLCYCDSASSGAARSGWHQRRGGSRDAGAPPPSPQPFLTSGRHAQALPHSPLPLPSFSLRALQLLSVCACAPHPPASILARPDLGDCRSF